ncbi:uncharacterized protein LOC105437515 [Strongylocentrotus purpuratus]|uniref:Uncharacterized protein n=1 Tax=Strongylocentrotus purpuratus TaxID=7668 RepID=A0A7M7HEX0_STRPU|nr:uncharacterized protein LOC105437515 [Strongylocentrotus purpuratus]|eukprot:XP_011662487.1 PREDICTED: uncharacterized protein LOC105437515 isoform X2 [Strongylocentrotus purpuratus]
MASKVFLTITVFVFVVALAAAMAFEDDPSDEEFDMVLDLLEKRSNELALDDDISNETYDMEKRGQGRGRFFRCTHRVSGHTCICDKRYRKQHQKYYRVCSGY